MARPLNMSELDWLKSELARIQKGIGNEIGEVNQILTLLRELYSLYVQCEEYQPDNPTVNAVQHKLGIIGS